MTHNIFVRLCLPLGLAALLAGCGEKEGFAITEFKVKKSSAVLLEDSFDGLPYRIIEAGGNRIIQTAAGKKTGGYQWTGQAALPENKRIVLTRAKAITSPGNPLSDMHSAMLETDIDPANQTAGLKPGMAFEVSATFDLTMPEKTGYGFFVGLSDGQAASGERPAVAAKDRIMLGVTRIKRDAPVNMVYFRSLDDTADVSGSITNSTFAMINPHDGDQIKLRLSKDDASTNRITASYAMVKGGMVGPYVDLVQTTQGAGYMPVFREHAYTRPMFGAFWDKENAGGAASGKSASQMKKPPLVQLAKTNPQAREEVITFRTRATTAKALLTYEPEKKPAYVAVMIPGGDGSFHFESTPDGIRMLNERRVQNRLRPFLLQRGIASALLDAPDDSSELRSSYRETPDHLADLKAALAEIGRRFPGVPLLAVGHSMGAWSATFLSAAVPQQIEATILIDPVLVNGDVMNQYGQNNGVRSGLSGFDWDTLQKPLLLIHHKKDDCLVASFSSAAQLVKRNRQIQLIAVDAAKDVTTGYCGLSGPHNLEGHEVEAADFIADWVRQQKRSGKRLLTLAAR